MHSDWRDGFVFIGNHPILDFLNTCPAQNDQAQELLPDFAAVLRWFAAAGLLSSGRIAHLRHWKGSLRARRFTEAIREFREELREDVLGLEKGAKVRGRTINKLNHLMSAHPMLTRLTADASSAAMKSWFVADQPEDLIAPLAHSAAMLFANVPRDRVRKCGQCVLHFYDSSKKGTRRWCSMQLCGNRLKVAAYAARQRTRTKTNS